MAPAIGAAGGFCAEDGQGITLLILFQCEHLRFDYFRFDSSFVSLMFSEREKGRCAEKQTESKPDQSSVSIL
jgi:hypothetical protein